MVAQLQFPTEGLGADVSGYTVVSSLTPDTPAPPFQVGDCTYAESGSHYIFVQASATINLGSVLQISNDFQANGLTSTNVTTSFGCLVGTTGQVTSIGASLTYIPAGAYFWAQVRGGPISLTQSALTSQLTTGAVLLFTTATGGVISSVTNTALASQVCIKGVECVSSTTPIVMLTWPRSENVIQLTTTTSAATTITRIANV